MNEKDFQSGIVSVITEILKMMGVSEVKIDSYSFQDQGYDSVMFSVEVDRGDSKLLRGQRGVGLFSLQHIVQMIARSKFGEHPRFAIDVNGYWKEKRDHLRRDAEEAAHEAVSTGRPVSMRPMFPYERKVVHAVLADNDRVETESLGRGEDRRVIVKMKSVLS
jgi:spoIIIJ-associated protein